MALKDIYHRYPEGTRTFGARTIVFTGVPGAGPTKFIHEVIDPDITPIAKVGEMIFAELGATGKLPIRTKYETKHSADPVPVIDSLKNALERIGIESAATNRFTVVDAQVVFQQGNELHSETELYSRLDPLAYVFFRRDPQYIWGRRAAQNRTPDKPMQTVEEIRLHQQEALLRTFMLAKLNGARFLRINNTPQGLDENVDRVKRFVAEVGDLRPRTKILRRGRWEKIDE